jgi:isopentenyl-diphosphate delta-isomerase
MINEKNQSEQEVITGIDTHGQLYPIGKLDAHLRNIPHLAISVFLFNRGRLLLQQRAACKYHSGGLWANTCCSHPRWNESLQNCAERRLSEELGCKAVLTPFGKIDYEAQVGELYENESAHCFVGYAPDSAQHTLFNRDEVQAVRWQNLAQLKTDIKNSPGNYSEWIRIYLGQHFDMITTIADEPVACAESQAY